MGRNTTTPNPASLDRFSIGEIQDISGVASFYDAGTSKWLRSATFTSQANLSASTKTTLAASATSTSTATVSLATTNDEGIAQSYPILREDFMTSRISSINTTVVQKATGSGGAVGILTINSSGVTSQTIATSSLGGSGAVASSALVSNGSKFFMYYYSGDNLVCKTSTDGITWTTEALSNLPATSGIDANTGFWNWSEGNTSGATIGYSYVNNYAGSYGTYAVLWCGAGMLSLSRSSAGYYLASFSTNGLAFSGDSTNAILGTTTRGFLNDINFYRNGNNCYLSIGTTFRKSTDGGATWSAATFAAAVDAASQRNIPNLTDATKRIIVGSSGAQTAYYTSDSGGTWSADRALPFGGRYGICYKGSTVIVSNASNGAYRSVDDGVTYTPVLFPAGTNVSVGVVIADDTLFYFIPYGGGAQILTSADGITWTIRTTPGTLNATTNMSISKVNSNTLYLSDTLSRGIYTLDGGVTWSFAATSTISMGGSAFGYYQKATTDGPSGGYLIFGRGNAVLSTTFFLSSAALVAGGAFYRTGSTAIAPLRTDAVSYVRVG
jgi:hypothetical protein